MAAKFCFKVLPYCQEFTRSFESADGEKYVVEINYPLDTLHGNYPNKLALKWKNLSSKYIQISINSLHNNCIRFSKLIDVTGVNSITETKLNFYCNTMIVIEIIPIIDQMEQFATKPAVQESVPKKVKPVVEKKLKQLEIDMRNLLDSGDLSDVILTDGSKEIPAHKLILCTRSPVFAKMFKHPTKENQENRITIEDISMDVLRQLLHFMYTGAVTIVDMNMAQGLYMAADKYDVKDLKNICSMVLKSVNLDSVLDTLLMAHLHSDKELKEASLSFISKNYSQVKSLQGWDSFMKDHHYLAIEILSFVIDKKM